ncbi:MAG: hypothetical protein U0694_18365 [Anaerolineae bacterium]
MRGWRGTEGGRTCAARDGVKIGSAMDMDKPQRSEDNGLVTFGAGLPLIPNPVASLTPDFREEGRKMQRTLTEGKGLRRL